MTQEVLETLYIATNEARDALQLLNSSCDHMREVISVLNPENKVDADQIHINRIRNKLAKCTHEIADALRELSKYD